jgi:hypothetical protein
MILKDTQLDGSVGEGRSSFPSRIAAAAANCGERSRLLSDKERAHLKLKDLTLGGLLESHLKNNPDASKSREIRRSIGALEEMDRGIVDSATTQLVIVGVTEAIESLFRNRIEEWIGNVVREYKAGTLPQWKIGLINANITGGIEKLLAEANGVN